MRSTFTVFASALLGSLVAAKDVQVLVLLDVTAGGFRQTDFPQKLGESIKEILNNEDSYTFALSTFADKPAPYFGIGYFGDYPSNFLADYCYEREVAFTSDASQIIEALGNLKPQTGLDLWEAQFEAAIRAGMDSEVGWKADAEKIVLMITDAFGHSQSLDTLEGAVTAYNQPVRCRGNMSYGGFGAVTTTWPIEGWVYDEDRYNDYAKLVLERSCVADLSEPELAYYRQLETEVYKVQRYPKVQPFSLETMQSDPDTHCAFHEYPDYADVVNYYNENDIKLFVMYGITRDSESQVGGMPDSVVWEWALGDNSAFGKLPNVFEFLPEVDQIAAVGTDSNVSLQAIMLKGFEALTA